MDVAGEENTVARGFYSGEFQIERAGLVAVAGQAGSTHLLFRALEKHPERLSAVYQQRRGGARRVLGKQYACDYERDGGQAAHTGSLQRLRPEKRDHNRSGAQEGTERQLVTRRILARDRSR